MFSDTTILTVRRIQNTQYIFTIDDVFPPHTSFTYLLLPMLPALQRYYYHFYYYSYSHISPIPQIRRRRVSGEPVELQQYTVKKVAITTNASFAS